MISRRIFLKDGALALVSLGFAPTFLARTVEGAQASRQKILITIFQRGAVDGLNMIVPFGEREYYASRPSIAVPRPGAADGAVDLDGFFGLHPRLVSLDSNGPSCPHDQQETTARVDPIAGWIATTIRQHH